MNDRLRRALLQLAEALVSNVIIVEEWRQATRYLLDAALPTADLNAYDRFAATVSGNENAEALAADVEQLVQPEASNTAAAVAVATGALALLSAALLRPRSVGTLREAVAPIDAPALSRYTTRFRQHIDALAEALLDGRITVQEWRAAFASEVADLHAGAYVVGSGGIEQLDADDFSAMNAKVDEQLGYLNDWAAELANGDLPSVQALKARSHLYAGASNATVYEAQGQSVGVALPQKPGDGKTRCHTNCACRLRFERRGNSMAVWWLIGVAEHCPDCLALAADWNPLLIPLEVAA